jgi:AraC-like DNA-binding protein
MSYESTYYHRHVLSRKKTLDRKSYLCRKVMAAKIFIDTNFQSDVALDLLASEAGLSKFHFIRLFRFYYGQTPNHYLTMVRVRHARKLLAAGNSVQDVCFAVGYTSVPSFAALFKKITGETPGGIRNKSNFR